MRVFEDFGWTLNMRCYRALPVAGVLILTTLLIGGASSASAAPQLTPQITEYSIPTASSLPYRITAGPDGALWFAENAGNNIGRISIGGTVTEYPLPILNSRPTDITVGSDLGLWFTQAGTATIGRIGVGGLVTEHPTVSGNSFLAAGPDGALWYTDLTGEIRRITTSGTSAAYPVPNSGFPELGITTGPDGALWFTEFGDGKIGRITGAGAVTEYPIPTPSGHPYLIVAGPDGALWFTELDGNMIGRIATDGIVTEYPIPTPNSGPWSIALGPDGALWFTEATANKVGRITTSGAITEIQIPTPGAEPTGITSGPDGNLWFAESSGNKIGKLAPVNHSLALDGVTGYADVPSVANLNPAADWSVEAWFKDQNSNGFNHDFREIINKGDRNADPESPYFITIGNNHLLAGVRAGGVDYPIDANIAYLGLDPAKWHHVAVTYRADLQVLNLWLDGNHISYLAGVPASKGNTLPVEIGRNGAQTGKYWLGKIDDVRLWNVALTDAQVKADYLTEFSGSPPANLVANWQFDEASGMTASDFVATNAATLHGGAGFSTDVHQ